MPISKHKNLMYQIIENMTGMARVMDSDNNIIYMNKSMIDEFGDCIGKKCYTMLCHDDKCQLCIGEKSIETSDAQIKELRMHCGCTERSTGSWLPRRRKRERESIP